MMEMIKKNWGKIVLTSAVVLAASLAGGYGWVMPVVMLAAHLLCLLSAFGDKRIHTQSRKALGILFWIMPVGSVLLAVISRISESGADDDLASLIMDCGLGLLFLIMGNYMPKFRQNGVIGIRVKWTLENEENWAMTHRFAGKCLMIAGCCCILFAFLPLGMAGDLLCMAAILIAVLIPGIYSWRYYKRQLQSGKVEKKPVSQKALIRGSIFAAAIIIFSVWVLFTGSMHMVYDKESFTIETPDWKDLTISYDEITSLDYLEEDPSGNFADRRTNGFGNLVLGMGTFKNDLYGTYTRYTYTSCPSCVVLTVDGQTVVLNGKDKAATKEIYERLEEMKKK